MKNLALVTYNQLPELNYSDRLLSDPFKKYGFATEIIPWDKKNVRWKDFDLVIIRSCWDYHHRIPEFLDWLNRMEILKGHIWNPVNIIRWNLNKKYLIELEKKNVPIIPTLFIDKKNVKNIRNLLNEKDWRKIIIKPAVGASSYLITKIKAGELSSESPEIKSVLKQSEAIIQPFMEEITTEGEYSFIFINKKFSHAIHKIPKKHEFRTQPEFGAKEVLYKPEQCLIIQTQKILGEVDSPLLYARVDGLIIDNQFYLMELELIEPYLYFEKAENSAENFAEAAILLGTTLKNCGCVM